MALLTSTVARSADCGNTTMPEGATPLTGAELTKIFAGKTWIWKDGGSYWGPGGKFLALSRDHKSVGKGTWTASDDGKVCYDAMWNGPGGNNPYGQCWQNVKNKDGYFNAVDKGDDQGKWWCSDVKRKGIFGQLKSGDKVSPMVAAYMKENGVK